MKVNYGGRKRSKKEVRPRFEEEMKLVKSISRQAEDQEEQIDASSYPQSRRNVFKLQLVQQSSDFGLEVFSLAARMRSAIGTVELKGRRSKVGWVRKAGTSGYCKSREGRCWEFL